ncbi:hypothetical protein [Pontibacter harenae]|uniref:hypothetical protein n=1 Tax=Pontibacter harenae TaxID=2894083 RepID=UPI001E406DDE|nr:hypothetical protein [Pontibacter harenae]MCC9168333.1 hypothetical protein [Pontibacter harenae]
MNRTKLILPEKMPTNFHEIQLWGKLRQEQISQAVLVTSDTILSFIKQQIEKGNWQAVDDFLHGKPMTKTGQILLKELRSKVLSNIMMRLGLRKIIAVGLVMVLLPFVLVKTAAEIRSKYRRRIEAA